MVTKIFLGLAIACGIGAIVVGLIMVKPRILNTEKERDDAKTQLASTQQSLSKEQGEHTQTKMTLASTQMELETTKTALASKTTEAEGLAKSNSDLMGEVNKVTGERDKARAENAEFVAFGKSMNEIRATFEQLPKVTTERNTVMAENKVIALENKRLQSKINDILGGTAILPENLTGKVVAVDPKYQFVVLNVGLEHGAKAGGEMVINRDGKYISTIRITRAEKDYSFANIVQDKSLQGEAVEGDQVLVSKFHNIQKKTQ